MTTHDEIELWADYLESDHKCEGAALIRRLRDERDKATEALREAYNQMNLLETPVGLQLRIEAILAPKTQEPTP